MYVCECYDRQAGMNLSHCLNMALHPISLLYRRKQIRRPRVIPAGLPAQNCGAEPRSCSHLCPLHSPDHLPQVFIWLIIPILLPRTCPVLFYYRNLFPFFIPLSLFVLPLLNKKNFFLKWVICVKCKNSNSTEGKSISPLERNCEAEMNGGWRLSTTSPFEL